MLFRNLCAGTSLALIMSSSAIAQNVKPSLFMDEAIPSSTTEFANMFNILKQGHISELFVRPGNYKKGKSPIYAITYIDDFESCMKFDDKRTLYQDIIGYKLSAGFFDKDATIDLFMKEPNSANLINGECLLGKPVDTAKADFTVRLKSKKNYIYEIRSLDGSKTTLKNIDFKIPTILAAMNIEYESLPHYKASKSNIGKVSEVNLIRALKSDNDTMKHTALNLISNRVKPYGNEYIITEPTQSPEVLETLLQMDFLKSKDEKTRAAVLEAIGVCMKEGDSAKIKDAILTALEAEYPLKIERSSRDFGKRFGISLPPDGEKRPGHMSQNILLGAAMALHRMSAEDRKDIISRYPESFQKFYSGTYKTMKPTRLLRELEKQ